MKRKKRKGSLLNVIGDSIVYIYGLILTLPLFFAIITAFKSEQERIKNPIGLPESFSFNNFVDAWVDGNMLNAAKNSIIITVGTVILQLVFVIIVSYALNCIRDTKIGVALYMLVLCGLFIPGTGGVTKLMMRREMGLYNNLWGEIFVGAFSITMGVFLVSGFLRTLPGDLEEAARIDGASDTQICFRIITPVIKPSLATIAILTFTSAWNSALGPMLTLRDKSLHTIPMVLLLNYSTEYSMKYTTLFAGVIMTSIPVIIFYCINQKHFVSALAGSVKG
ncbi:MAG: carbohydrate ABC transporter permease [Tyzzerella sp.]|nr:carbohydrate ABC transporter permease [Tyzzerella sp.]